MNVKKLKEAVETLKNDLGDGLLATGISGLDGQAIAGYNVHPKACVLFRSITDILNKSLKESGFPELGKYYILDLVDGHIAVVIPLGDFQWLIFIDSKKVQLGLLLNIAIPHAIDVFEKAITS